MPGINGGVDCNISIHAPAKERRHTYGIATRSIFNFNPRSCEGATLSSYTRRRITIFQSTLLRRSDLVKIYFFIRGSQFQSTLLRRSDPDLLRWSRGSTDFNPRSCEGATSTVTPCVGVWIISIHAPAKERHFGTKWFYAFLHFNPRSCEGATTVKALLDEWDGISIHAPAKERLWYKFFDFLYWGFQSTLLRRSDMTYPVKLTFKAFQSTLLRRSDC